MHPGTPRPHRSSWRRPTRRAVALAVVAGSMLAAASSPSPAFAREEPIPDEPNPGPIDTSTVAQCFGKPITLWVPQGGAPFYADPVGAPVDDDVIMGTGGDDDIWGGGGNDLICQPGGEYTTNLVSLDPAATDGIDVIHGDTGDDWIDGGSDPDQIYGGEQNDVVYGGGGNDVIDGGSEDDWLFGNGGADWLICREGYDIAYGGPGADALFPNDQVAACEYHDL